MNPMGKQFCSYLSREEGYLPGGSQWKAGLVLLQCPQSHQSSVLARAPHASHAQDVHRELVPPGAIATPTQWSSCWDSCI